MAWRLTVESARSLLAFRQPYRRRCTPSGGSGQNEQVIYELRVYTALPGRMPALLSRFEMVTLGFWEEYGIRQVGFFTTAIGPDNQDLTYLLAWESLAEREQKWNSFQADPDWIAARAASEADGQIVARIANSILTPTAFSALT